jgi:hypothetical protein
MPLLMNQWFTEPQCRDAPVGLTLPSTPPGGSAMQIQPRSLAAMESRVKQTTLPAFASWHGTPFNEMVPGGSMARGVVRETPCGTHGPPIRPVGIDAGCTQLQLANGTPGAGQVQVFEPSASIPQVTQQSWLQATPQATLWQPGAQAPPAL